MRSSLKDIGTLMPKSAIGRNLALLILIVGGVLTYKVTYFYQGPIMGLSTYTPKQPIPFSHKQHAGDLKINCQYCHTYARRSEMAGVPSISTCNNCHANLAVESDAITFLKKNIEAKTPIEWERVFKLPDHVFFNHKRHIKKEFECQKCHGPIETMEVVGKVNEFKMGFCLDCHQQEQAPTDCWTCHT
ncbi:MAG: cytochrome c family protein [Nitrospinota bacterium]|nr:cytochrome c family protein [Nitrospinota bacterium]